MQFRYGLIVIFFCMVGIGHAQKQDLSPEVRRGVEIRIEEYIARKQRECQARVLERALFVADSIMRERAFQIAADTMIKPPKPKKPMRPPVRKVPDTTKIAPLFKDE